MVSPKGKLNVNDSEAGLLDKNMKPVSLSSLKGKVVYIDFWASWCEPCKKEVPALNSLYKRYAKRGLIVVGVNVDDEEGTAKMGDVVRIIECRPLSHLKRWKLGTVVRRAAQVAVQPQDLDVKV